jgi:mRNA interferase HigB
MVNVVSKTGLLHLLQGKSIDVREEAFAWYATAKAADWSSFAAVREHFPNTDLVNGLLVFNIRGNRFRLIVFPAFSRRKLYIKALLTHKEYDRKGWEHQWP